ncbi:hypothetical protein VNI00_011289 [Paramarasmius palmivorus]|uniref:Peroxidase n=1 Tax=Paramarasmius palmivorus TaxID=297713 RepID=A0AAW0CD31_9AGAR
MQFKNILTLLPFVIVAQAGPFAKRAECGHGRTAQHAQCCVWYDVLDDLQHNLFNEEPCGKNTHESLRLSFHDAVGFSPRLFAQGQFGGGGADGSIIAHQDIEMKYDGNKGLKEIVERQTPIGPRHDVAYGDLYAPASSIFFSVEHSLPLYISLEFNSLQLLVSHTARTYTFIIKAVNLTDTFGSKSGAPRLEFLAGRNKTSQAAPDLLPSPADSPDKLLDRLGDAGFSADELVDLLISHTIGGQEFVDPEVPHTPFDSTPETFDTQFFVETLLKGIHGKTNDTVPGEQPSPLKGEFRLASDSALARDPRTSCRWQSNINNQQLMQTRFRNVMAKLAVTGHNRDDLVDCSEIIPVPKSLSKKAFLPAGKSLNDIEAACSATPFPTLTAQPGPETSVHTEFLSISVLGPVETAA